MGNVTFCSHDPSLTLLNLSLLRSTVSRNNDSKEEDPILTHDVCIDKLKCLDVAVNTAQDKQAPHSKTNPASSTTRTRVPTSKKLVYRMTSLSQFHRLESCGITRTRPAVLCRPSLERRVSVVPSKLEICVSRVKRPPCHRLLELQLERI
jgi:hypothetical protein